MTLTQFLSGLRLPLYLLTCLILGGASAGGHLANGLLQATGLILIAHLLYVGKPANVSKLTATGDRTSWLGLAPEDRLIEWLLLLFIGWLFVQMIPMPPFIWQNLPGRTPIIEGDAILGMADVWRPISMQPGQTLFSGLGLIPPVAILMLALRTNEPEMRVSIILILAVAVISMPLGLIQLAQGPGSPAYFYDITNDNASVGFFANSNHLATLCLIALVFCADLPYDQKKQRKKVQMWRFVRILFLVFLLISLVINRSLAGFALTIPVLIYWASRIDRIRNIVSQFSIALYLLGAVAAIALTVIAFLTLHNLGVSTINLTQPAERLEYYSKALSIGWGAFPFGTGQGSFRWVYNLYEDWDQLNLTYVNHAHGDFVEFFMENGLVALLLLGGFVFWFANRIVAMISGSRAWAQFMAPAAMVIIIIGAHSLVDYPIRTSAIAAIFAMCVGMLVRPLDDATRQRKRRTVT